MSKRHLPIQRNAKRIALPAQETYTLIFFKVFIEADEIKTVEEVRDFPFDSTQDNSSLAPLLGVGFAFHLTWYPEKPTPRSELRYKGLLAVHRALAAKSPALADALRTLDIGFGHVEDADVEWHAPKGDDA